MIPNPSFVFLIFEFLEICLKYISLFGEDSDLEDEEVDGFLIISILYILHLLTECQQILILKENVDMLSTRKIHKLLRCIHGYR